MEMLHGEDLSKRIRDHRPIEWETVRHWAIQIAGALAAVHRARLIHRDVKPSNLFLVREPGGGEQVKLIDFGIAKHEDGHNLTGTGHAIGTPLYMSPEQLSLREVDGRSDVYSLGVVLYELLCGQPPFRGDAIQVGMQHCTTPPPPLSGLLPPASVPGSLQTIVLRALAKDPERRFPTAEAMQAALLQVTPDDPLAFAATGLAVPGHHWLPQASDTTAVPDLAEQSRHPLRSRLLIAISIAAFIGLVALSVMLRQNPGVARTGGEAVDPLIGVRDGARRCRARYAKAPPIIVRYDIAADGTVLGASTDSPGPLSSCLLVLIESAHFPRGLPRPDQTIEL